MACRRCGGRKKSALQFPEINEYNVEIQAFGNKSVEATPTAPMMVSGTMLLPGNIYRFTEHEFNALKSAEAPICLFR